MLHETRVEEIEVRGFSTDQHRARGSVYVYVFVVGHLATLPSMMGVFSATNANGALHYPHKQ